MVLIYNLNPTKEAKLKLLCRRLNIETRTVEKHEYGCRLGYLLGISEDGQTREGEDFEAEMLYISGIQGGMLSLFIDKLRRERLIIPLKAIQTPTNVEFTSFELYRELQAEREAIAKNMTAHK